jgi:capsular polysaccharide transport system permease protein
MAISPQDGGAAADAAKRPALKAVETVPEAAAAATAVQPEAPRKAPRAVPPQPAPAGKRAAPPRTLLKLRHYAGLASFLVLVLLPLAATVAYLYLRAEDEYHSDVSFSIRSEEPGAAAAGILGAITGVSAGGSAAEPDILFEYIRSQEIVAEIDREIDLRAIFNRKPEDWVFSLGQGTTIEDLLSHWRRMVRVSYENHSGIIQVRATAFTPEDAQAITGAVLEKSTALVNRLAEQARTDAIGYARIDLDEAEAHLRDVRRQMASFRREHRMVDPQADAEGQMGLLTALQEELAKALVERDMLLTYAEPADQRVQQANRRITAISDRIEEERGTLGDPGNAGKMPELVGDYESLRVDLEFASQAYTQALANLALARAEARRQSRYLAAHVEPTVAESALYPRRALLSGLAGLFLLLGWGVIMLVYYNVRDNR